MTKQEDEQIPNHIDTKLTITGDSEQLKTFRSKHLLNVEKVDYEGKKTGAFEDVFDFNTIVPMPELLKGTTSPRRTGEDLVRAQQRNADMDEIKGLMREVELADRCEKKYGYSDWYSFKIANWGTKWGAYGLDIVNDGVDSIEIRYQTAWSPATPIFDKLTEMYPKLRFEQHVLDEGMGFAATQIWDGGYTETNYDGKSMYEFANDKFDNNYVECKCGEWYDSAWTEDGHDDSMCYECNEAAIEGKEEA